MTTKPRRVHIVGGGLAGLGLGLGLLQRGIPATISEAGHYPRHRVCGEFITGLKKQVAEDLGLTDVLRPAKQAKTVSWHGPNGNLFRHHLPEPALCLSRYTLDANLAEIFQNMGGELRTGQRETGESGPGKIRAIGRRPKKRGGKIGLKRHVRGLKLGADLEIHLGRGCYVGVTRVEDDRINVCGLFNNVPRNEKDVLAGALRTAGLSQLSEDLAQSTPVEGSDCAMAGLGYSPHVDTSSTLGDAAAHIPPFSGHGMAMAWESAWLALPPLVAWAHGMSDWDNTIRKIHRLHQQAFRRRLRWAWLLHPLLLGPVPSRVAAGLLRARLIPIDRLYQAVHH